MAVPRSRKNAGAGAGAPAAAPAAGAVAAGINLAALPAGPNGAAPAGGINLGAPVTLGAPAGAVDPALGQKLDSLLQQMQAGFASVQATLNSMASLQNDTYQQVQAVAEAVEGLYEGEEEAPETPQAVATAKPPKGKAAAADTFEDVPLKESIQPNLSQLNGHPVEAAAQSLVNTMGQHGYPGINPQRVAAWLTSLGAVANGVVTA